MAYKNIGNGKVNQLVRQFTEEHNRFCSHIWTLNEITKKFYIAFLVTNIPLNLLAQHQVLFESIKVPIKLVFIYALLFNDMCLFGLQAAYALVSKKIHAMNSKLSRLQWSLNGYPFRMRIKFKLLMSLERISAKQKIGFTIAGTAMTFPLFSKVIRLKKLHMLIYFYLDSLWSDTYDFSFWYKRCQTDSGKMIEPFLLFKLNVSWQWIHNGVFRNQQI